MDHELNAYLDEEITRINKQLAMRPRVKPIKTDSRLSVKEMLLGLALFLLALAGIHAFLFFTPWGNVVLNWIPL